MIRVAIIGAGIGRASAGLPRLLARDPVTQDQVDAVLADVPDVPAGFARFFRDLADRLGHGTGNPVSAADGRRSVELVTAICQAARSGQWVSVPPGADTPLSASWKPEGA